MLPRRKPAVGVLVVCGAGALLGLALTALGVLTYLHQKQLDARGVRLLAQVTDSRFEHDRTGDSFELRYAFQVPGHAGPFTLGDETGGSNLWGTTSGQESWELARESGQVEVLYLPEDPRINRLASVHGSPLGDAAACVVLGLALLPFTLWVGGLEATGQGSHWRRVFAQISSLRTGRPPPLG